ncbi:unnamed protein product [Bursaphelenchus xylophilus]|uniref:(pine wood nematode) hypothetical protein n=1 Tax=Bursaphelenchus xylophilus TaxID=6326 RepID=A0A7I8XIT4_BURXY|nr:unnamed protein product [Bursaphelenchus xylophilus]CAG9125320.1 unnamed protein product [Bursaphelenchus xylophilus]
MEKRKKSGEGVSKAGSEDVQKIASRPMFSLDARNKLEKARPMFSLDARNKLEKGVSKAGSEDECGDHFGVQIA